MRIRRVDVTDVGSERVAIAEKTNGWTGWSHSSRTARAMLPSCRMLVVLRSPARITGASSASWCAANGVSFWKSAAACLARIFVCAQSSGLRARCVEMKIIRSDEWRWRSSTKSAHRSLLVRPVSGSARSTNSRWSWSMSSKRWRRQKMPQPSADASRGRLRYADSKPSLAISGFQNSSYRSSSTSESRSELVSCTVLSSRSRRLCHAKCRSCSSSMACCCSSVSRPTAYLGQPRLQNLPSGPRS